MRLINADAFIEEARNRIDMQDEYLPIHIKYFVIDEMPTIDAVQVLRCKDCKHYDGSYSYPMCWRNEIEVKADDYCSFGEKGEKNETYQC